jgi:hypothetical protein
LVQGNRIKNREPTHVPLSTRFTMIPTEQPVADKRYISPSRAGSLADRG